MCVWISSGGRAIALKFSYRTFLLPEVSHWTTNIQLVKMSISVNISKNAYVGAAFFFKVNLMEFFFLSFYLLW